MNMPSSTSSLPSSSPLPPPPSLDSTEPPKLSSGRAQTSRFDRRDRQRHHDRVDAATPWLRLVLGADAPVGAELAALAAAGPVDELAARVVGLAVVDVPQTCGTSLLVPGLDWRARGDVDAHGLRGRGARGLDAPFLLRHRHDVPQQPHAQRVRDSGASGGLAQRQQRAQQPPAAVAAAVGLAAVVVGRLRPVGRAVGPPEPQQLLRGNADRRALALERARVLERAQRGHAPAGPAGLLAGADTGLLQPESWPRNHAEWPKETLAGSCDARNGDLAGYQGAGDRAAGPQVEQGEAGRTCGWSACGQSRERDLGRRLDQQTGSEQRPGPPGSALAGASNAAA